MRIFRFLVNRCVLHHLFLTPFCHHNANLIIIYFGLNTQLVQSIAKTVEEERKVLFEEMLVRVVLLTVLLITYV